MVLKKKKDLPEADLKAEAETDYLIRKKAYIYTDLSELNKVSEFSENDITVFINKINIPFLLNKYNI